MFFRNVDDLSSININTVDLFQSCIDESAHDKVEQSY